MKIIIYFLFIFISFTACEQAPPVISDTGSLPVIKITIDEKYLWSPDSGLYVIGENGISMETDLYPYNANYNQKWEFPAQIEYLEEGKSMFKDPIGFRIKGNASRAKPMKTIGCYWRKEYRTKKLNFTLFPEIETKEFKRILLRNSGNDFGRTHLKDASIVSVFKDYADVEYQAYKPCVVYLNNEYWGIHNIREMITPHHFEYHYGVDDDAVDFLGGSEINPYVDDGKKESYMNDVVAFLKTNDLSDKANYNAFSEVIDVNNYMDYIIINTYIYNRDWPLQNSKWWKDGTSENYKRWRWVVFDTDQAMGNVSDYDVVWLGNLYGKPYNESLQDEFFILNHLLKNEAFKLAFLKRYMFFIDTVFEKGRVEQIILKNQAAISQEYINHQKKWNTFNISKWDKRIQDLIEFNNKRNDFMRKVISNLTNENS